MASGPTLLPYATPGFGAADAHLRLTREELHHRFLNTLTVLRGLLHGDFGGFEDPGVQDAVAMFEGRLAACAWIHRTLRVSAASGDIDVPLHFSRLCAELTEIYLAPRGHRCEFSADEGAIDPDVGEKLGQIVTELVTNSAKHAFPGVRPGRVCVSLRRWSGGWTCVVQDDGCGARPCRRLGEGLRLVHDLAGSMQADVAIHSDEGGVRITLHLPQSDRSRVKASAPTCGAVIWGPFARSQKA